MKAKTRTIYSNFYAEENYNAAKDFLMETYENPEDITEDDIWEEYNNILDLNWHDEKVMLETMFDGNNRFVLMGTIGRWDGPAEGGFTFSTVEELSLAWEGCDYIHLYDENGHFFVEAAHHDGTNHYEIRQLTEAGIQYEIDHRWDMSPKDLHTRLWKYYSRLPHYANKVFGCPKREYEKAS